MPLPVQLSLPFACLDFPGRSTVTLAEIALKIGGTVTHYVHLVEDGTLAALDLTRHTGSRRMIRVPIEEYQRFVLSRLTSKERRTFIAELPVATLREIAAEIEARIASAA